MYNMTHRIALACSLCILTVTWITRGKDAIHFRFRLDPEWLDNYDKTAAILTSVQVAACNWLKSVAWRSVTSTLSVQFKGDLWRLTHAFLFISIQPTFRMHKSDAVNSRQQQQRTRSLQSSVNGLLLLTHGCFIQFPSPKALRTGRRHLAKSITRYQWPSQSPYKVILAPILQLSSSISSIRITALNNTTPSELMKDGSRNAIRMMQLFIRRVCAIDHFYMLNWSLKSSSAILLNQKCLLSF
jgi:hypothetical protein